MQISVIEAQLRLVGDISGAAPDRQISLCRCDGPQPLAIFFKEGVRQSRHCAKIAMILLLFDGL